MLSLAALIFLPAIGLGVLACRSDWWQLSRRVRTLLLALSGTFLTAYVLMILTQWGFASRGANHLLGWLAVGGYSLLVSLLTTLSPKWLTRSAAALLLLLSPVAALWMFATTFSGSSPTETQKVGATLFVDKTRWDAGAMGGSGADLVIYERPRYAPFLMRELRWVRFDDAKCNSQRAFVVLQPDQRHVLARCPFGPEQTGPGFHDFLIPLYSR
jgi:hypothetical protein